MLREMGALVEFAEAELDRQAGEIAAMQARQLRAVIVRRATGNGNMDHTFELEQKFRLVYVRCHFAGGAGTAAMKVSLSSGAGSAYNTQLLNIAAAGVSIDVHQRLDGLSEPSPWTFQKGDSVKIDWTNPSPGTMTWGLEVGMALAS